MWSVSASRWVLWLFLLLPSTRVLADFIPPVPTDYDKTKVSLITIGRGDQLHARMGHSILRIQDFSNNMDYLANWGMFNFQDPFFIPKFFRGVLMYRMAFSPYQQTIAYYRDKEQRSVAEDELALTRNQKQALIQRIIWNAQPENLYYPYHYFRNNCATRPRDDLDLALKSGLRRQLGDARQPVTYRQYVWRNLASNWFVGWGLDVIFNSDTDFMLTKWEEMFYPLKLREYLRSLDQVDDDGRLIFGRPLVSNSQVLVDLPEPKEAELDGYLLNCLLTGVLLLLVFALIGISKVPRSQLFTLRYRLFGVVSLWWGLTVGFFGLTHFSSWAFSSHTDLYHNINSMLFWPVDILLLIPGIQLAWRGEDFDFKGLLKIGFWQIFARIHIVFIFLYVIFAYSGVSSQDVRRVVIYMVPLSLLYYLGMIILLRDSRGKNK